MAKPQQHGSYRAWNGASGCRSDTNPMQCRGTKSFADDLGLSRGVVLSRAAASLRSIETKPFDWKICPHRTDTSSEEQKVSLGLRRCTVVLPAKLSERGAPFTRRGWMELSLETLLKETSNIFFTRGGATLLRSNPVTFRLVPLQLLHTLLWVYGSFQCCQHSAHLQLALPSVA